MSEPKSSVRPASAPKPALDAVMADKSANPLRRALWLDALDRQLRPQLPPPLRSRCRLANVDGEHLVFLVESPVWHAKLRLAEAQLLDAARSIGLKATRVTIKTASPTPTRSPALENRNGPHAVSAATHKGLRDALACLQDVPSKPKKRS
ncbi:DciA family protein [Stenotrophomonas maltophilia group sp. vghtpe118]|uniref:DciA family protein n=1 Tax=Stenotrophomonas maltophilia group sp. vghtpe118 TaxID=3459469 RepID=UPI004042DB56